MKNEYIKNNNCSSNNSIPDNNSYNEDFILPQRSYRLLTDDDVRYLSNTDLALARNEIYARHGYIFVMEPFKSYFPSKGGILQIHTLKVMNN